MSDAERSGQSDSGENWYDAPNVIIGSHLGPFRLTVTVENYTEDEDGTYHASEGVLRVVNSETDEVLIDEAVEPIMGPEFTTWDQDFWYDKADAALRERGYDPAELGAAMRNDAA